jgi:tripartite-type tricarboxylate transporter receptor subunit TctC
VKIARRTFLHLAAGAVAPPVLSRIAWAQVYPTRPITIIVPFAAGGGTDTIARVLAERMRLNLGQPVVVENVSAAAGTLGVGRVARAPADGYTLSMGHLGTHVVNGAVQDLKYDLLKDFAPVALISRASFLILSKREVPAGDLRTLIAWLRANPDRATAGTAGIGSPEHLSALLFQGITDTRFAFVPYRGGGPAMQDLVAGQIDLMIGGPTVSLPHVRAGSVRAYAVAATDRLQAAPEIPTSDEAGASGFYFALWHGLWAPTGVAQNIINTLNGAVIDALSDPAVRARLAQLGQDTFPAEQQTPAALALHHKSETEKWWPIITAANLKVHR